MIYESLIKNIITPYCQAVINRNRTRETGLFETLGQVTVPKESNKSTSMAVEYLSRHMFSKDTYSKEQFEQALLDLLTVEKCVIETISSSSGGLDDNTLCLLIKSRIHLLSICQTNIMDIEEVDFYIDHTEKTLAFIDSKELEFAGEVNELLNLLRREYYTVVHALRFIPTRQFYQDTVQHINRDVSFSKSKSPVETITAVNNYISISIDHLQANIFIEKPYIDVKKLSARINDIKRILPSFIKHKLFDHKLLYKVCASIFSLNVIRLKYKLQKKGKISSAYKIMLLVQCRELIRIFYNKIDGYELVTKEFEEYKKEDFLYTPKQFEEQVSLLVEESGQNTVRTLFLLFTFLYNFEEYRLHIEKIYLSLARKTLQSGNQFYYLLSTIMYLKATADPDKLKNELIVVKTAIEEYPLPSLICQYNNEIESIADFSTDEKNRYKIDPFIVDIYKNMYKIKNIMFSTIENFKNTTEDPGNMNSRLTLISHFKNEIKNVFSFARDPNLLRDFTEIYSLFLGGYIKKMKLSNNENELKKIESIKLSLFEINPLILGITLLYTKLGKLLLILNYPEPDKIPLTGDPASEKQKRFVAEYFTRSREFFPADTGIDWEKVHREISSFRSAALKEGITASGESRVIKVICAVINKMTRQELVDNTLFEELYKESYVLSRGMWDLDPIIIYYFNRYISKRNDLDLYFEKNGQRITHDISLLWDETIIKQINLFIKALMDNSREDKGDVLSTQLEETSQIDSESLMSGEMKRKEITQPLVRQYVKLNSTVYFENSSITKDDLVYLLDITRNFCIVVGAANAFSTIKLIVMELITNADTANQKRAWFQKEGKDFTLKYRIAINDYIAAGNQERDELVKQAKEMGLKTKVQFQVLQETLIISVSSNRGLHPIEVEQINKRFSMINRFKTLNEVYQSNEFDKKDGSGHGILIMMFLMQKLGISADHLNMHTSENETTFKIQIPYLKIDSDISSDMAGELTKEVDEIPMIPENIRKLQTTINNPDSTIDQLETMINRDISLAATVLKTANSAFYSIPNPVKTVRDAVKIIGLKGLANLVIIFGSYKLLEDRLSREKIEEIIEHSEKTAYFARELATIKDLPIEHEEIFLSALIHDIGKIVVEGLHPGTYAKIARAVTEKKIPVKTVEDLLGGLHHDLVGYNMTKKWNFPDSVCSAIRYHHSPRDTEAYFNLVFTMSLADSLVHLSEKELVYENIDDNVLTFFDITSPEKALLLAMQLSEGYKSQTRG
jgi:HD-like signal output (HDOD) protein